MTDTPKTAKGNTLVEEVWVTHYDSAWGPYLSGVSNKPWEEDYDAPITRKADNTRFVNAESVAQARARDAETIRELVAALMAVEKETNSRRQGEIATTALITFAAQEKNDD